MATKINVCTSLFYPRDVSEALKSILGSENISDIHLKGNDGIAVPVSKCILAAWSPVFHGMLYGNFSEASASTIYIDFPSTTIQQLVEFCYTNKVEFIEKMEIIEDLKELQGIVELRHMEELLWLFNAANYYQINKLKDNVKQLLGVKIFQCIHWTSCYVLEEATANEELLKLSLDFILAHPHKVFKDDDDNNEKSMRCLSAQSLSKILENDSINASESFLFKCLQLWADLEDDKKSSHLLNTKLNPDDEPSSFDKDKRKKDAVALAKHINLARIPLSQLASVVESSGLVNNQDLLKAYEKQALSFSVLIQRGSPRFDVEWELLQDLHRSGFAGAIEIDVQGAGIDGVNGTYVLDGEYEGKPEYYNEGKLNGEDRFFFIYYGYFGGQWVLGLIDESDDDYDEEILYKSETNQGGKIPTTGWKATNDGYGPAPTFTYKEDEI